MQLEAKVKRLKSLLRSYGRVALAFSGGVDSSLLLKCALETLGIGNVLVLFARSELLTQEDIGRASNWLVENGYPQGVEIEFITSCKFYHFSQVHHANGFAHMFDHRQIVSDEQIGQSPLCLELGQQVDDLRLN